MDDLAVLVPAHVEPALVLVRPLLGHVVWCVAASRGIVQEEGFVRRGDMRILDELDGLVGKVSAQVVAILRHCRLLDPVVVVDQLRVPLVGLAAHEPVIPLEAAAEGPAVIGSGCGRVFGRREVPLPDTEGVVALLQQHLGKHPLVKGQDAVVAGVPGGGLGDRRQPDRVVIPPGQDASTRRRAEGRGVHVGVGQAVFRQLVQHGCLDQPAEGRQLAIADIVKHEEDDVRCTLRGAFELPARPARIPQQCVR